MKVSKIKSVFLALSAVFALAVLCLGLIAVNGVKAYADAGDGLSLNGYEGENFVYSAEFTPADGQAQKAGLVFGAKNDLTAYWAVTADVESGKVILSQTEDGELKTAAHQLEAGQKFKLTVITNDGAVKVFVNSDDVAVISCKLDGYKGGKLGVLADGFTVSGVTFTDIDLPEGNIFCNGYDVLKVVNMTDGNYKLKNTEYTVKGGVLTVSPEYVKTLEAGKEYTFRAVTSFTDLNFKVTTDFTAVTATPAIEKYYRDNDVTLELSTNVKVNKILIDGKECKFSQKEGTVTISSEEINGLSTGKHSVKLYTDKGRPETNITVAEKVETVSEPVVKSTHMWLWIDLAIFFSAIVGYAAFSIISKRKKK